MTPPDKYDHATTFWAKALHITVYLLLTLYRDGRGIGAVMFKGTHGSGWKDALNGFPDKGTLSPSEVERLLPAASSFTWENQVHPAGFDLVLRGEGGGIQSRILMSAFTDRKQLTDEEHAKALAYLRALRDLAWDSKSQ